MININAVQIIAEKEVVSVRAVPFVTGDDISPLGIAQLLANPEHGISAYVLNANGTVTKMLPKEWRRYADSLNRLPPGEPSAFNDKAVETLPASTFVHLEDLWNVYVDLYLPSRSDLADYTVAERENFQLQRHANIPRRLVDLVFAGFHKNGVANKQAVEANSSQIVLTVDKAVISSPADKVPLPTGMPSWFVKKPQRRDPLTDALLNALTSMQADACSHPKARDILDFFKTKKPAEIYEILVDELKYVTSSGNAKSVSIESLQKRLNKLVHLHSAITP